MATFGGITCDLLHERKVTGLKARVDLWTVPGIDGYGAQDLGLQDSGWAYTAVAYGSFSDVEQWMSQMEALQGTVISLTDDFGYTRSNLLATRIEAGVKTPAAVPGDLARCRGEVEVAGVFL